MASRKRVSLDDFMPEVEKGKKTDKGPKPEGKRRRGRPKGQKNPEGSKHTGPRFDRLQRADIMRQIAILDAKGFFDWQIAQKVDPPISLGMVAKYKVIIHERWKAQMVGERDILIKEKLKEYRIVRQEAWEAWERSKQDVRRVTKEKALRKEAKPASILFSAGTINPESGLFTESMKLVKSIVMREGRLPSNEYLATIVKTLDSEAKLLGLFDTEEGKNGVTVVNINWDKLAIPQQRPDVLKDLLADEEEKAKQIQGNRIIPHQQQQSPERTPQRNGNH